MTAGLHARVPLIIPVENQVRELDPKLLLACVAAQRGFSSIIGSHRKIDFRIASLPRSLYLCKSFTVMNLRMFRIMHRLGQKIVSWDEEALVHLPADMYYSRRLSPLTLKYVSHLFAWGRDNAEMWRRYPQMPGDKPIHLTGNPRADLLRPEMRRFYEEDAATLRRRHGRFILVNTNFNHVNAFYPAQNLLRPAKQPGQPPSFGKAARGMSRPFAEALHRHKQALFEHFLELVPQLDAAFPGVNIVVRPHPTENPGVYHELARRCRRVTVSNDGNVVPWLMAAEALVHNGCTTAVEAYLVGVPAVSYRPVVDEDIDEGFYRLPNRLSHQCFDAAALKDAVAGVLDGRVRVPEGEEARRMVEEYLVGLEGPLACERMLDAIEGIAGKEQTLPSPDPLSWLSGWSLANGRRLVKWFKRYLPGSHAPPEFHRHRYPGISLEELCVQIERFRDLLGGDFEVDVREIADQVFRLDPVGRDHEQLHKRKLAS